VNAINFIVPYRYEGMWVFDDARVGLDKEPFVSGADDMIDVLAALHARFQGDGELATRYRWLAGYPRWFTIGSEKMRLEHYTRKAFEAASHVIPEKVMAQRDAIWPAAMRALAVHEGEGQGLDGRSVVQTRPEDWEKTDLDLSAFIRQANEAKAEHPIFQEDAPTELLPSPNPNVLFLWKGSLQAKQEALLILNKDIWNKQHFYTNNLYEHVQAAGPLYDVSPEFALDYLPTAFEYGLRPGQGIVLVTEAGRK